MRQYQKNAETIRALQDEQEEIRKMLAGVGVTPEGDTPIPATVHQLRVVKPPVEAEQPIPKPFSSNMKDMARAALIYVFKDGATNGQMVEFFEKQWNQKVRTDSFSVALSTMRQNGEIIKKNQLWYWNKQEGPDAPTPDPTE